MPFVCPEISCNLQWRNQTRQLAYAKQGEYNSRKIAVQLYDGSNRFTFTPGTYTGEFAYRRPDGAGRAYTTIDDAAAVELDGTTGTAVITLEPEVLGVAGIVECELRLKTSGSLLATFTFGYYVEQAVVTADTPSPSPDPGPTPTPTGEKTKFFGFASQSDYETFMSEYPGVLLDGDIVVITSTSSGDTLHSFYVLVSGVLTSRYVITVPAGGAGSLPALGSGYGTSSNGATTVDRTVSLTGYELTTGGSVKVLFTTGVNATDPTLNVNSTGAKAIWYHGTAVPSGTIKAGDLVTLVYDGTQYRITSIDRDLTDLTSYLQKGENALPELGCGYCVCSSLDEVTQKTAVLANYIMRYGGLIAVKFTYPVNAGSTLNINSTYDVPIYWNGAAITADVIGAGEVGLFSFDGTNYNLLAVNKPDGAVDPEDITEAVEGWLEENIDNPSNPPLDKSLSVEGAAADAAAVGVFKQNYREFGMALLDALKKLRWDTTDGVETLEDLEDILLQQKQVVALTALFEQGQTVIYNTQSLESLRQYLTVTATYADTTTGEVTGYTLSGNLTPGTSTITVTYRGITTTFTVTVTLAPSLDDIAYGSTTYRQMFITNNQCFISDFEMPLTISSTAQQYETGVYYKNNSGAPSISAAAYSSPGHSLKAFGSSSQQLAVEYRSGNQHPLIEGNYFLGACVNCSRRSAGRLGITFASPINGTTLIGATATEVTDGWTAVGHVGEITAAMVGNTYQFFIGSISSANLDGYVDDVVFISIPDGMTEEQALELYENFLLRVRLTT